MQRSSRPPRATRKHRAPSRVERLAQGSAQFVEQSTDRVLRLFSSLPVACGGGGGAAVSSSLNPPFFVHVPSTAGGTIYSEITDLHARDSGEDESNIIKEPALASWYKPQEMSPPRKGTQHKTYPPPTATTGRVRAFTTVYAASNKGATMSRNRATINQAAAASRAKPGDGDDGQEESIFAQYESGVVGGGGMEVSLYSRSLF